MKIDYNELIKNWNKSNPDKILNKAKLARELVANDFYKSEYSALNMIHISISGKAKKIDYALLKYLIRRFNLPASDIIQFDN